MDPVEGIVGSFEPWQGMMRPPLVRFLRKSLCLSSMVALCLSRGLIRMFRACCHRVSSFSGTSLEPYKCSQAERTFYKDNIVHVINLACKFYGRKMGLANRIWKYAYSF